MVYSGGISFFAPRLNKRKNGFNGTGGFWSFVVAIRIQAPEFLLHSTRLRRINPPEGNNLYRICKSQHISRIDAQFDCDCCASFSLMHEGSLLTSLYQGFSFISSVTGTAPLLSSHFSNSTAFIIFFLVPIFATFPNRTPSYC